MIYFLRKSRFLAKVLFSASQGQIINTIKMGSAFTKSCSNAGATESRDNSGKPPIQKETDAFVEQVVCNESDLNDNDMKVFDIGNDGKVLIIKQKGEINAIGTKCTHYGAPLVAGALGDGRVRCQWHGACFNIKSGDIEDFPGFDSLPCYKVTVTSNGEVKVRAKLSDLKTNRRIKELGSFASFSNSNVVIIGGGPSGATCAETLRSEGFSGRIIIVAKENFLPYDRIKVSKIGTVPEIEKLQIRSAEYYQNANIEILKATEAIKVDTKDNVVYLSDGSKLNYNSLYIASGSKPRRPEIPGINLSNIYTVRDLEDSVKIQTCIGSNKDKDVVALGLSFIGLEIASSCNDKAKSMTVVGKDAAPLAHVFGKEIGQSLQKLFEEKGVKFVLESTISKCNGENGVIKSVELTNGTVLPADILILGVGTTFYTEFLRDSGINLNNNGSVSVNAKLQTNVSNVYAGGDIACAPVFANENKPMAIGHIGLAQYHGRIAALNILNKERELKTVPYFWTVLFGKSIRYSGCGIPTSVHVDGDINELKFVIFFFNESDKVIAVGSCMRDPIVSQFAEFLNQGKSLYKKDVITDPFAWTKTIN